jgi:hypothetical protein
MVDVMTTANMTTGVASMGGAAGYGWIITAAVALIIITSMFVMFKNFRRLMYGLPVVGILYTIYFIAKSIGFSAADGDLGPLNTLLWIVGIILGSTLVGKLIEKTNVIKKIEGAIGDDTAKKNSKKSA